MSPPPASTLPVAAFGDPASGRWGIAVGGSAPLLAIGPLAGDGPCAFASAALDASASATWTVSAGPLSLRFDADQRPAPSTGAGLERCRVTGTVSGVDGPIELDAAAVRCPALEAGRLDSMRLLATWFPDGSAAALVALRPAGARGQDRDAVAATITGEPAAMGLFDPRLSTTYDRDGVARRAGIELWLGESEDGETYSRRFAAEMLTEPLTACVDGRRLEAYPLRSHGRAGPGAGVYVLARPA
jgi:hypothetical protein